MNYAAPQLISNPVYLNSLQLGLVALTVQHTETLKSIISFFIQLTIFTTSKHTVPEIQQAARNLLLQIGENLTNQLLVCAVESNSTSKCIPEIAELLLLLMNNLDPNQVRNWVTDALKNFGNHLDNTYKNDFMKVICNNPLTPEKLMEALGELYDCYEVAAT